jgi:hypothetical protein
MCGMSSNIETELERHRDIENVNRTPEAWDESHHDVTYLIKGSRRVSPSKLKEGLTHILCYDRAVNRHKDKKAPKPHTIASQRGG